MKLALQITAAGFAAFLLPGCGTSGSGSASNHPSNTGPFDSRGNYVEDWADSPSKWKRGPASAPDLGESLVVANDQPPADSVPIPTAANTPQPGNIGTVPVIARPNPTPTVSTSRPKTTSSSTATASRPKPKVAAAKPKPKATKPKTVRYTIKRGDTLSAIASRNGTTVSALQRANGIKGSLIQPGKSLVIPK